MTPEQASPGTRVRVMDHHRLEERRGLMGTVVASYGRENYVAAVDVRLADGECRLFWPRDLSITFVSPATAAAAGSRVNRIPLRGKGKGGAQR